MDNPRTKVSVVVPVYRSEQSLPLLVSRLAAVFTKMNQSYEIILVDDASPDNSWQVLKELKNEFGQTLKIARLLTNRGQHNATLCGFSLATGDIVITMDDDLQNPPEEIPKLIDAVKSGYDLVIAAYDSKKHSAARNAGGAFIDWIIKRIFKLPRQFQLTSFRAAKQIVAARALQMSAAFPYITCMLLANSSNYTNVLTRHDQRPFGMSNYNIKRNLLLAANLIISYSSYPLILVGSFCILAFAVSILLGARAIFKTLVYGVGVPGWASTVVIVSFFNAIILLCLSIIGLYLLRINQQITRTRVSYTVSELHE
jgi:dolichol-phosphate mannosyltransferase/undecaprenyl-phosphate 4-deoxy-4-formamido-L-arabinose transferase